MENNENLTCFRYGHTEVSTIEKPIDIINAVTYITLCDCNLSFFSCEDSRASEIVIDFIAFMRSLVCWVSSRPFLGST